VRLTLRHPPPSTLSGPLRCAYLEALAWSCIGVPLGPCARLLTEARGRGRHGNALQWHFGLEMHDGLAELDWERRIEIKLVSVWTRADGSFACDKLKVCDTGVSPWEKLSNVLWVFADRLTRVIVGARMTHLAGSALSSLAAAWRMDPHFDHPYLFVEARETKEGSAPAYYIAARWFEDEGILPANPHRIGYPFDSKVWGNLRGESGGRDPLVTVVGRHERHPRCGRCGASMHANLGQLNERGWVRASHMMPLAEPCALHGHLLVAAERLPSPASCSAAEMVAGVEARVSRSQLWRLADRVLEPEDHMH